MPPSNLLRVHLNPTVHITAEDMTDKSAGPSTVPWRTLLITGFHWLLLVTAMNSAILPWHIAGSYLTNSIWEDVNNFLMGCCYNTLPIDFNDPMANTHTSSLCNASSHKATDLQGRTQIYHGLDKEQRLLTTRFLPAIYESTFKCRLATTNSKITIYHWLQNLLVTSS